MSYTLNSVGIKKLNITKYLREKFGGTWKYDGTSAWFCDDGKRHVARVASCFCDDDYCNAPPAYYLYEDGAKTKSVYPE